MPEKIANPFYGDLLILQDLMNSKAYVKASSTLCLFVLSFILLALPISSTKFY